MKLKNLNVILIVAALQTGVIIKADVFNMPFGQKNLEFVSVGNPGNAPDTLVMDDGATGYGPVGYTYCISKCEITAGQYTDFLNAVAATSDPYGLYSSDMAVTFVGSQITKSGSIYTASMPNEPVNWVSWGDAARFCNWLQTGTTENGAYALNGHTDYAYLISVTRNPGATYVLPTENEWYKAAYYDPNQGGSGVGGYWLFPTKSNTEPSNVYSSTGTNNANYWDGIHSALSYPPYTTEVGSFANSLSAYGTLDQGGNVWEWNETAFPPCSARGLRGGSMNDYIHAKGLAASTPCYYIPTYEMNDLGFRVARVPEPGGITLCVCVAIISFIWCRCRK